MGDSKNADNQHLSDIHKGGAEPKKETKAAPKKDSTKNKNKKKAGK